MIEFKTYYTPGPWEVDHSFEPPRIYSGNDTHIADVFDGHNANLKAQSVKFAEYMMDRAKELYMTKNWISSTREEEDEEYRRIISILKDAGVEVVE